MLVFNHGQLKSYSFLTEFKKKNHLLENRLLKQILYIFEYFIIKFCNYRSSIVFILSKYLLKLF